MSNAQPAATFSIVRDMNLCDINMAFSMPRNGVLTQLSAYFSNLVVLNVPLGSTINIVAQLYRSTTPNNIFAPVPGAIVTLPLVGPIAVGFNLSGTTPLAVAVSNQDRLLLVSRVTVSGTDLVTTVTGYISAGLAIA